MTSGKIILRSILLITIGYLILCGVEGWMGQLWFDSYQVRAYESSIDHFAVLRIFLLLKVLFVCTWIAYLCLRLLPRQYWKGIILLSILFLPFAYLVGYTKYKCDDVYKYLKGDDIIYEGRFFEYDPMLGKRAIKNAEGYQDYWIKTGKDFRKRLIIDSLGFRIPEQGYPISDSSLSLFLGCSFTWGDGCTAEQTYPYQLSKRMGVSYINAGQSAYGLGQMTLLAEKLIPAHHPKYVFVQYSPWLIQRSLNPFKPTVFLADITFPYVMKDKDSLVLERPPFEGGLLSFDSERYRTSPSSIRDKLHFYYDYGVRVVLHDFILRYSFLVKSYFHKNISTAAPDKAEQFLYKRIFDVAHRYGCKVYVVRIGGVNDNTPPTSGLFDGEQVINADSALKATANNDPKTYGKLFYHWAMLGTDTVIADVHPNPYAHSIIASEIYRRLNASK